MKIIILATIILLCVGAIFGSLILYDNLTSHSEISNLSIISKDQAIAIALKYGNFTPQNLGDDKIEAELLQAHLSNRVAFVIDPATLSTATYPQVVPLGPLGVKENQLFWQVTIKKQSNGQEYHEWGYFVDATNGTLLKN